MGELNKRCDCLYCIQPSNHTVTSLIQKTKEQKREELYNKKRSRKSLNQKLLSLDFGFLGPPDSESSDEDMYTGPGVVSSGAGGSGSHSSSSQHAQFKYQRLPSPTKRKYYQVCCPLKCFAISLYCLQFCI